jgi:VIT1/CCC1 family predicted Fe2+/Mn2+ transporter
MKQSLKIGMGFGLASATITTLGLMIGLESSTGSKLVVLGGILTIAIADSCSDALGIHIAKESEGNFTTKEIWQATFATFLFKAIFTCSFLIPVLIFPLNQAIYAALVWGALILIWQSYNVSKDLKTKPGVAIFEHLSIALFVVIATHYAGRIINAYFK